MKRGKVGGLRYHTKRERERDEAKTGKIVTL